MNFNEKWLKDLEDGNNGEKNIARWLKQNKSHKIISFNDDNKYDILTEYNNKQITYEIKTDNWEFYHNIITNNIFIEVMCNGKLSGVMASQADVFVYYFEKRNKAYFIKMSELKRLLNENPEYFKRTIKAGDGGKVTAYLINREKYSHLFKIYDILLETKTIKNNI